MGKRAIEALLPPILVPGMRPPVRVTEISYEKGQDFDLCSLLNRATYSLLGKSLRLRVELNQIATFRLLQTYKRG